MKNKLILVASVLLPFFHIMLYVWNTAGVSVFRDDMYLIRNAVVEKFCDRTLTFADLWRPTGGSRLLGYHLLLVANTAWCGLNSHLVVFLIPSVLLTTACLLYKGYQKSLSGLISPTLIARKYAQPMLILFNLTLWEGLTFDYAINFVWSVPWFLASFYALEAFLLSGSRISWLFAIIIPSLAILVFGQASSFACIAALIIAFGCYAVINRRKLPRGFSFRVLAGAAMLGLTVFLYLYRIQENDYFPGHLSVDWRAFTNLWKVLRFVLATLSASVVGVDALEPYFSLPCIIGLGALVAVIYAFSLVMYFRTNMYERTYLPLFLMAYSLAFVAFMTIGRFQYGHLYGMSSRYTCSTICGIIAIIWIRLFAQAKMASTTSYLRMTLNAIMVLIFAGMCWTMLVEWQVQPDRKEIFERLPGIALRVDTASDEELAFFEERPSLVRDSLRVLRKYQLNVYRPGMVEKPDAGRNNAGDQSQREINRTLK